MKISIPAFLCSLSASFSSTEAQQRRFLRYIPHSQQYQQLVREGPDGSLIYEPYENLAGPMNPTGTVNGGFTNTVPDFSNCGYKGGGVPIPFVEAILTLTPTGLDDTAAIQGAIDALSSLTPDAEGFRGAILLKAGEYFVSDSLNIAESGIVVRGEGQGIGGTKITYTKRVKSDLFMVGKASGTPFARTGGWRDVVSFVPTGAKSFTVETPNHGWTVGTKLVMEHQPNQAWLDEMSNMTQYGWTTGGFDHLWFFTITGVDGATIYVDLPITQPIDPARYGGAQVDDYLFDADLIELVGIENMQLVSEYDRNNPDDEEHGWTAIEISRTHNAWVRQVTARYFNYGAVSIESWSSHVTVQDTAQLDPWGKRAGGRRYSFNVNDAHANLFQRCFARDGRHDFVSGSKTPGPNVWVDSVAVSASTDSGPHLKYSTGQLYDNIYMRDTIGNPGAINVRNRGDSGGDHGWSGAQVMIWNCDGEFICDAPNNAMNWAVGNVGVHQGYTEYPEPAGIHQSIGAHVTPRSLYFAQLKDRLDLDAVRNIVTGPQEKGAIWTDLLAWAGEGRLSDALSMYSELAGQILLSDLTDDVIDIWGSVEDLVFLADGPITYTWSQTSGPLATIADSTSARTTATIPGLGSYTFILVATNSVAATISNSVTFDIVNTLPPTDAPTSSPTRGIYESFDYYPEHEAFVRSSSPDRNYDVNGNLALAIGDCCGGERIPYLRWDDLNVNFESLTEATLRLRVERLKGTISFKIHPCESFDEGTLTYNTQPVCDTDTTIVHVDTANGWPRVHIGGFVYHEFDLLPYLQSVKPTFLSIVLMPDAMSNGQVTYSSEYETQPEWPLLRLNGVPPS
eukprot:scaffold1803_cov92-Amphora_coffeaeformis.AAC.49